MSSYSGKILDGRYKLLRQVATGGMGEVWTARDFESGRHIAVKILKPELAGQDTFLQRLRMEARNAMQIEHPGLAAVLDHGEEDGLGWIVMEYVEGLPFNEYLRDGNRIAPDQLIPVLIQTAYALQAAHAREVVHRDIKPSNLIITPEGVVKLTDFGISVTPNQATMTEAGMVMGTAQYLPPEQAMGEPATHAGDLYALGVIAYEALAGRRPFTGKTQVDVAFAHVNEPVPPLPDDVPADLARIVTSLLRKKPSDRPRDGATLARQLATVARNLGLDTAPKPLSLPDATDWEAPAETLAVPAAAPSTAQSAVQTSVQSNVQSENDPAADEADQEAAHSEEYDAAEREPEELEPETLSESEESAAEAQAAPEAPATPLKPQRAGELPPSAPPRRRPVPTSVAPYRHSQQDPQALSVSELAVIAVVALILTLLIFWLAKSPANATSSYQDVSQTSIPGNLAGITSMEVPAWLTTNPTA